ncbi:MAG: hypothetical protein ACFWUL_00745 [Dialister sp.]|jgi:hypothetical protein
MTVTVLQLLNSEGKNCIPVRKKDFSTPRSCSDFGDRAIQHVATARNDEGREEEFFRNTVIVTVTPSLSVISSGGKRRSEESRKNRM